MCEDNIQPQSSPFLGVIKLLALKGNRMTILHQETTNGEVGSICVYLKRLVKVRERENGLLSDGLLQGIKAMLASLTPCLSSSFL